MCGPVAAAAAGALVLGLIGALGAAALLPAVDAPAARPALGAALGAAALASPLPTLLAAAAALAASLRCLAEGPVDEGPGFALSLAAGAAVVATGACESAFAARPRSGDDPARAALAGGVLTVGALLWLVYGLLIRAMPVVAANALVFAAAAWTDARARRLAGASPATTAAR